MFLHVLLFLWVFVTGKHFERYINSSESYGGFQGNIEGFCVCVCGSRDSLTKISARTKGKNSSEIFIRLCGLYKSVL